MKFFNGVCLLLLCVVVAVASASDRIQFKGKVRKRNSRNQFQDYTSTLPYCPFNTTVIENTETLLKTIQASKYIFTGKVLNLRNVPHNSRYGRAGDKHIFKIFIRRVLKGNLNELDDVHFEPTHKKNFNGATVYVLRDKYSNENCTPSPRVRYSAIFLADSKIRFEDDDYDQDHDIRKEGLRLVVDPVPISLYHLDRINAAVKGKFDSFSRLICMRRNIILVACSLINVGSF